MTIARLALAVALSLGAALPLRAQDDGPLRIEITDGVVEPMPIAIAPFHGDAEMAARLREVVEADLTGTSLFRAIDAKAFIAAPESFTAPVAYEDWRAINAQALITAEVTVDKAPAPASPAEGAPAAEGGQITVKFRLFDVIAGEPLGEGMQFVTAQEDWRRAAHKLADQVYARLTGEDPYFDSRVAFIQETGPKDARLKRLGVMDYDGQGIDWLTDDAALVLSPRFSPDGASILYTSFETGFPQIRLMDVATVTSRAVTDDPASMAFAPRFSPDGRWIVYSRESSGNSDIWLMDAATAAARPLVEGPGIDTSPDFSPDGSQIVFESDRSGDQQLYTMPLTGGEPVRISFGEGRYSTPVWSPKGDVIAFTRQMGETFHIGTMRVDGSEEKTLTGSFLDEGPSWAPNGRVVMFTRVTPGGDGEPRLHSVDITGRNMRPLDLDFAASDPSWGPLLP